MKDYNLISEPEELGYYLIDVSEDVFQQLVNVDLEKYYSVDYWAAIVLALREAQKTIKELPPIPSLSLLPSIVNAPFLVFYAFFFLIIKTIHLRADYYYMNTSRQNLYSYSYINIIAL